MGYCFASGLIYGFMTTGDPQTAVNYGAAHGALAMTTPGDTSMATLAEVEKLVKSGPDMVTMGKLPQTPRAKKVIEYAVRQGSKGCICWCENGERARS